MTGPGARLTSSWVRLYTRGAETHAASRRAGEVASDVWEHAHDALAQGRSPIQTDVEILLRCLRGIPADISWGLHHRSEGRPVLMHLIIQNGLGIVSALLAAWFFVVGVGINFGEDSASAWWSVALFASGVAVLAGLWLLRRSPWVGCAVLAIGTLPLGIMTFWMIFPPVLALAAIALAVVRARNLTRPPTPPLPA